MVTLGILVLLLLLITNWTVQVRSAAVWTGESGSSQTSAREARQGKTLGIGVKRLLAAAPLFLAVRLANQPLPAHAQDSTLWNCRSAQPLRGRDLCRCARNYKERLWPCLLIPML